MKKYLPFSRRQPSLDRFAVSRSGWAGSDRFNGKSLRRTSAASLNTRSIQVVRGAYNIDLNKVDPSFTKLHRACLLNDEAQVKKHIQKVDKNSHDSSNRYPIHLATVNGNVAIIKLLIENGANPDVLDNEGHTPLIKSIECGHEHLVKFLLNNGADPNLSDLDNNTALHWAIMTESIIAIDALLCSKKCDLTLCNNKDETCLHLAVRSSLINTLTFELMVRGGSDLTAKDRLGLTVLDIAQAWNNKVAMNAFNRCGQFNLNLIESAKKQEDNTESDKNPGDMKDDNQHTNSKDKSINDEYKQKYILKNRENLEYEKKLIQLAAQIERLKLDMSFIKEENEKLETDCERLSSENALLKNENSDLLEQIRQRDIELESRIAPESPLKKDSSKPSATTLFNTEKIKLETTPDSVDCREHQEFLVARALNQERINKLKGGLTTLQL